MDEQEMIYKFSYFYICCVECFKTYYFRQLAI